MTFNKNSYSLTKDTRKPITFTDKDRADIKKLLASRPFKNVGKNKSKSTALFNIEKYSDNVWYFFRAILGCGGSEVAGLLGKSSHTNAIKMYGTKFPYLYRDTPMTDTEIEEVIAYIESRPMNDSSLQYIFDYGHHNELFIPYQYIQQFEDCFKDDYEELFSKKYGRYMEIVDVEIYKDSNMYLHGSYPMFADFDYRIRITFADGTVEEGIFECKTASSYGVNQKWEGTFPEDYECQVRHYMCVANVNFFVICCMADNMMSHFFSHIGFRDEDFENDIMLAANDFWNHVISRTMPKVDENVDALDDLLASLDEEALDKRAEPMGAIVIDLLKKRQMLVNAKSQYDACKKDIDEQIDCLDTQILQRLNPECNEYTGEDDTAIYTITLKPSSRTSFDKKGFVKAFPDQKDNIEAFTKTNTKNSMKIEVKEKAA